MAIGKQSVGSTANLFQGYWSHVEFRPNTAADRVADHGGYADPNNARYLGVVQEGVLEISREDVEYLGTSFPRVVELLTPSQMGMKFSGQLDELHLSNMKIAVGEAVDDGAEAYPVDGAGNALNGYVYPGASCGFSDSEFGSLYCRRKRCNDSFVMEAVLWKTVGSGALSIGGDADVVGTPVEFNALDDSNGEFMDPAWKANAADYPLGYLFVPNPAGTIDAAFHQGAPSSIIPDFPA